MNNSVSTEVKSLNEIITERIKKQFVELVPEERWAAMVAKEIEDFTTGRPDYYGKRAEPELNKMIQKELETLMRESIRKELQKPEWQEKWENGGVLASDAISKILTENIDKMMAGFVRGIVSMYSSEITNRLRNY